MNVKPSPSFGSRNLDSIFYITGVMSHYAVRRNQIDMLPKDLNIIDVLRSRSRQFLKNASGIAGEEKQTLPLEKLASWHKLVAIDRPERVRRRNADRLVLLLKQKIDDFDDGAAEEMIKNLLDEMRNPQKQFK